MRNPFIIETSKMPKDFTVGEQESLIELSFNESTEVCFQNAVVVGLLDTATKQISYTL